MSSSNATDFIEKLKKQPRIISSLRPSTGFDNKVSDTQLNLHNQWAKPAFNQSKYIFSYSSLKMSTPSNTSHLINDLTPIDDSNNKDDLNIKRIEEIYNTKIDSNSTCSPLSSAISFDQTFSPAIPRNLLEPDYGWLSFSLGKCILPKTYESQEITGFIQLYNGKNITPLSEPVKIRVTKGEVLFSQTIASSVNFPISIKNPYILCVLSYIKENAKCSIPFALNIIPLFNEKGQFLQQKKFTTQWASYSIEFEDLIKKKISNDESIEKVDIEFDFNCTFSDKLEREFSYSWSLTPNTNFCVSPFPTISSQSTPIILLYDINMTMKFPSNSKFVFLKLFVTEGIENISSPVSMPLFTGIESGKYSNCFVSTALKTASKEVKFIDHVPIYVDRLFPSTTCIVIHIYSFDNSKNGPTLIGYSAVPLYQEGSPLPFGSYKLKIFDVKKPPKELKKLIRKSGKKKDYLQLTVRLPPPYFPPITVKNVVEAVIPEQALPPNYKEISLDVYQRQILPMTSKLLKIIAPNTALHLIRFLDIFENEKMTVFKTLRSWIFNVMNPELFGSKFVDNLCNSFKSVINDEYWNNKNANVNDPNASLRESKNVLLKQLGFALPLVLDIILICVSTPGVQYDQDVILDFLAHIPGIIYGLIKNRSKSLIHGKNDTANRRSSRIHSHHMNHLQNRIPPLNSSDNDSSSTTSTSSLSKENQGQSSRSSAKASIPNNINESVMSPLRLPPRALAPIIPEVPTNQQQQQQQQRPISTNDTKNNSNSNSNNLPLIQGKSVSSGSILFRNAPEEIDLNNHFGNLVACLLPIVGFDKVSPLIFKFIRFLNTKRESNPKLSPYLSYLQFSFLMPFSYSEQFIVELALRCKASESSEISAYIPILSQIYLVLHKSLSGQNETKKDENEENEEDENGKNETDAINVACKFFVNICLCAEELPCEISKKVAFILFPLINIISSNYEGALVKNNSNIMKEFIPVILFILNSSSSSLVQNYFSELGASFQSHFLNFLEFIVRLSIEQLNTIRPVSVKFKRASSPGFNQLNLNFFSILTQHILNFLIRTIDTLEPSIELVVKLLSSLYNSYQPISNIPHFYNACSLLIMKYPVNRSIIAWLLSLLSFEQPDTKCFACALLVLVFQVDFKNSKTVIISSIDMMDSLTAVLLAVPVKYIPTYKTLLQRIISLTKSDSILDSKIEQKKEFEKMVNERMSAALIISTVVEEQKNSTSPPEVRCQRLMRIADQYKMFPTMRLKWLLEIVKVNSQLKSFTSAFTAQLHVCALIETVVEQLQSTENSTLLSYKSLSSSALFFSSSSQNISHNKIKDYNFYLKTTQPMRNAQIDCFSLDPKEDFSFMPGVLSETELNIESLGKDSQTLLSDFTCELLLDSLDKAITLGKSAGLEYSLRPLYSLQLRIHQFRGKQPEKISLVLRQLSESISNIQTKSSSLYDLPLSFFLVEHRKSNSSETKKQVFCVENSIVDNFITFINSNNRFDDGSKASYCNNHNKENCNKPGVCVVRLQPLFEHTNHSKEFDHSFKKFVSIQNIDSNDSKEVDVVEYTTKDFLPHYRLAADVLDEKHKKVPLLDHLQQLVDNSIDLLNRVASEFEVWFPMKPTKKTQNASLDLKKVSSSSLIFFDRPNEKYVLDDIKRISAVLRSVLKGNESIATVLSSVSQKVANNESEASLVREMADSIYKAASRLLSVYRRAVSEFQTKQPNESLLSLCDMMADEFSQQFNLEKIEKSEYVADYDPMNDGIDYD